MRRHTKLKFSDRVERLLQWHGFTGDAALEATDETKGRSYHDDTYPELEQDWIQICEDGEAVLLGTHIVTWTKEGFGTSWNRHGVQSYHRIASRRFLIQSGSMIPEYTVITKFSN